MKGSRTMHGRGPDPVEDGSGPLLCILVKGMSVFTPQNLRFVGVKTLCGGWFTRRRRPENDQDHLSGLRPGRAEHGYGHGQGRFRVSKGPPKRRDIQAMICTAFSCLFRFLRTLYPMRI